MVVRAQTAATNRVAASCVLDTRVSRASRVTPEPALNAPTWRTAASSRAVTAKTLHW